MSARRRRDEDPAARREVADRPLAEAGEEFTVGDGDRLRRARAPEAVGDVLDGLLARTGWSARIRGAAVVRRWPEVVGDELARRCEPVRLAGGTLVVRAESPAWATQVRYLTTALRDRANELLGDELVAEVQVVVGPLGGDAGG